MGDEKRCAECETILPADAPHGICPACALRQGLETPSEVGALSAQQDAIPTLAELALLFLDLEILELIGRGGMGAVYKARQRSLDRLVALKILSPGIAKDPAFAERFSREAQALARLNHPHIVTIYDSGVVDGLFYFVMEYVDGMSLRELMAQERSSPSEVLRIIGQICEALQYAHDTGVVHRDIKPDNILLDKNVQVKIADFGVAKLAGDLRRDLTLTEPGAVMGTAYYMAPEQMERPNEVDHRADIYSLGVIFYQLLTGELPLGRFPPPSQKAQVGERMDEVVLRALEKDPQLRYQRAATVRTDLQNVIEGNCMVSTSEHLPALPSADSPRNEAVPDASGSNTLLALGIFGAIALVIAGLVVLLAISVGMLGHKATAASPVLSQTATQAVSSGRRQVAGGQRVPPANKSLAGKTAVSLAIGQSSDNLRRLIAEGQDVNEQNRDRSGAPLHMAAVMGDRGYATAQLLVEAGADVNARANNSWEAMPLMLAAANNGVKLTQYLISKGAEVNATDKLGRTALDFAEYHQHPAVIDILKQAGANAGTGVHVTPRPPHSGAVRAPVEVESAPVEIEKAGNR